MVFSVKEIGSATMVLFAVIDIIGATPLVLDLKQKNGNLHPLKTSTVSLVLMVLFLFLGEQILSLIGIDIHSFAIAGSFILFFLALEMILGIKLYKDDPKASTSTIVPLAFPVIAGAGTMTSLVSLRAEYDMINIIIAIFINILVVYIVLRMAGRIERMLGPTGLTVVRKVFGIVLLAIAVKLFSKSLIEIWSGLPTGH